MFVIIVAVCFHYPLLYMKFLFDIHVPLLLFTIYRDSIWLNKFFDCIYDDIVTKYCGVCCK